jgi:Zn-dependent protease
MPTHIPHIPSRRAAPPRKASGPFGVSNAFLVTFALFLVSIAWLNTEIEGHQAAAMLFLYSGWIIAVCLHEFGHALVAYLCGDHSVASKGYLTLDPLNYSDPLNSIFFPLLMLALGFLAFPGAAVYIDHRALRRPRDSTKVALAGPLFQSFFLVLLLVPFWAAASASSEFGSDAFWFALHHLAILNLLSLIVNLLPLPTLDGFNALKPFLTAYHRHAVADLEASPFTRYAVFFLIIFVLREPIWQSARGLSQVLGL